MLSSGDFACRPTLPTTNACRNAGITISPPASSAIPLARFRASKAGRSPPLFYSGKIYVSA